MVPDEVHDPVADRALLRYFLVEASKLPVGQRIEALDKEAGFAAGMPEAEAAKKIDALCEKLYAGTKLGDKATRLALLDKSAAELLAAKDPMIDLAAALTGGFAFTGTGTFPGQGGDCTTTLASSASCKLRITFTPSGDATQSTILALSYHDGVAPAVIERPLEGTATTRALLEIWDWSSPACDDCGAFRLPDAMVGELTTHTFTLSNRGGGAALTITPVAFALTAPFDYPDGFPGGGTCGATLAKGTTCTFIVRFQPLAAGSSTSVVQLDYADATGAQPRLERHVTATAIE